MPISIQCPHCSGTLKVRDESAAGKKVRCPKCEEPFVVELPVEDDFTGDSFANADFGDTGEEEEEEAPVRRRSSREDDAPKKKKGKKKKGGNSMAWVMPVAIGVVVLALVGGLGTVAVMFGGQLLALGGDGNKIDMTYLPPDAAGVAHVRLADVWNSPLGQQFANMPQVQQQMASLGTHEIKPPDITGVTLSIPKIDGMQGDPEVIVVMRCKKRVDMSKSSPGTRVDKLTHNGSTYYKMVSPGSEMCAWQPSGTVVVLGSDAHVKRAIERGSKKTRRPEFDFIDPSPQVVLAALNTGGGASTLGGMPGIGDFEQKFKQNVKGVCIGLTVRDGIDMKAALECNPGGASDIKTAVDKALQDGKQGLAQAKKSPFAMFGPAKEMFDVAEQTMSTLQVAQNGDQVALTGSVPSSIKPLIEKLAAQAGGPAGMQPPRGPQGMPGPGMPMPGAHGQPMPMPMPGAHGQPGGPPPGHGQPPR
jgi:predicted Zn finger-like uncharacterized protein